MNKLKKLYRWHLGNKENQVLSILKNNACKNIDIINLHRKTKNNIGDYKSSPCHYFKELKSVKAVDIWGYKDFFQSTSRWSSLVSNSSIIVGGGGLLNRKGFEKIIRSLELLAQNGKKIVLWGIGDNGTNYEEYREQITYNVNIGSFGLVGLRDYNGKHPWVPCVSCMDVAFDKTYNIENEISVLLHSEDKMHSGKLALFKDFPIMFNDCRSFEEVVKFIGKTETLITNSYHAMYWGILLKRKVAVFPNSSKMFHFKYKVPVGKYYNFRDLIKDTKVYDEALDDCREQNIYFSKKVFNYLGL